jgi:hypothetical protein
MSENKINIELTENLLDGQTALVHDADDLA